MDETEELNVSLYIDVCDDYVIVNLPDTPTFTLNDDLLMYLFDHPEAVRGLVGDDEKAQTWNAIIPEIVRIRNNKRELYEEFGFENF